MKNHWIIALFLLSGCTTPYVPPVFIAKGHDFPGIVDVVANSPQRTVDVMLIPGMCTHDEIWAKSTISSLINQIGNVIERRDPIYTKNSVGNGIDLVTRIHSFPPGNVRFTALLWSSITAPLKQQLKYDNTGIPSSCEVEESCHPARAVLNGKLKDILLNDCLADALIYQGKSRISIQERLVVALREVLARPQKVDLDQNFVPIIIVADSLGSKMIFDALLEILKSNSDLNSVTASDRLSVVFMQANQLPLLGLADQVAEPAEEMRGSGALNNDSLQLLLQSRKTDELKAGEVTQLSLVAFTDPNDLLSYRLESKRYMSHNVKVTNVLVSNDKTLFGFIERPDTAHQNYKNNDSITKFIVCGKPTSIHCR